MSVFLDGRATGVSAHPLRLSAANASSTVRLGFAGVFVGDDRVVAMQPLEVVRREGERLRLNGSFALGVARRCCLLLGPSLSMTSFATVAPRSTPPARTTCPSPAPEPVSSPWGHLMPWP